MGAHRSPVSETELEVLKALWGHGPATVRELAGVLREQGREWAYTTVQTLLNRLQGKGYLDADTSGVAHVFRPAVNRESFLRQQLADLADTVCGGTATPLVMALVDGNRLSREELAQLRRLLDEKTGGADSKGQKKEGTGQ
ncbi:MAG: BlaI/MecI/CopY family transcriptional regulator [Candidatus Hydrogenedentes bacterium]|nr:BlaI/MecI/CopY family transcriptional regulator [Candidatus Hydrogenedentota bacterium]